MMNNYYQSQSYLTEKTIVLNMLRMAATGEINMLDQSKPSCQSRPSTSHSQYVWNPHNSSREGNDMILDHKELYNSWRKEQISTEETSFKLPVHDTIIRSAQSRLSMKNHGEKLSFHDRLQNDLDRIETRRQQSRRSSKHVWSSQSRPQTAGLVPNRPFSQSRNRPRSRSAGSGVTNNDPFMPTPPVKVQISQVIKTPVLRPNC